MELKTALKQLADDIKSEVLKRMESEKGINTKTGTNTLVGSNLYKSVDTRVEGTDAIVFQIADYYTYVVGGWTKSGKGGGTLQEFIDNVDAWMHRKGIQGNPNRIVWAIYRRAKAMRYGIDPRPFLGNGYENPDPAYVLPFLDDFFNKWADDVFDEITKEIDKIFSR